MVVTDWLGVKVCLDLDFVASPGADFVASPGVDFVASPSADFVASPSADFIASPSASFAMLWAANLFVWSLAYSTLVFTLQKDVIN
jgi:hypothetical protein